jgi:tRNA dimethylallyltransferase
LINQRSERMVSDGLLDEVRALVDGGYGLNLRPLQSVGYRQMGAVFQGKMTLTEALEEMKQQTRHLAKRQLTWFRRDAAIAWFHPERQAGEILEMASGFLDQSIEDDGKQTRRIPVGAKHE